MPEPVLPGLAMVALVGDVYTFIGEIKDAPHQIQTVGQSLDICFKLLGSLKSRLEAAENADESAVDVALLRDVERRLFDTCRELSCLLGPYKDAAGTTRRGWLVKLKWTLKKRRLKLLEADLERWERNLNSALNMAQWYVHSPLPSLNSRVTPLMTQY
jgi:hypothetical protein